MKINLRSTHKFLFKSFSPGFTMLEMLICIAIISIIVGGIMAMKSSFQHRLLVRDCAIALQEDLRVAQLYAMNTKDEYRYFGVRFFDDLPAPNPSDPPRQGWRILRYEPKDLVAPVDFGNTVVMKGPDTGAELFDYTVFQAGVSISSASDFEVNNPPKPHSIVFDNLGSAFTDGLNLVPDANNEIILQGYGQTVTLRITPITGHIDLQ